MDKIVRNSIIAQTSAAAVIFGALYWAEKKAQKIDAEIAEGERKIRRDYIKFGIHHPNIHS
jgi:hypothetical protein